MANKPIFKARSGNISGAVWKSEREGEINFSFSIEKRYKTKSGEFKKSDFYFMNEAADLMAVAVKLISYDPFASGAKCEPKDDIPGSSELPKEESESVPF